MSVRRQALGRAAEEVTAERLRAAGWELVERNARTRYGELDLVARDGEALVFVEVKAGRAGSAYGPERPVHAIDWRKQRQVRRLAVAWLAERDPTPPHRSIRFDAIGVTYDQNGQVTDFEHLKGAF